MGTVPTPRTWTAGDDATSGNLQTVSDGALYALGSSTSGGSRKPLAQLLQTVSQTIPTSASVYTMLTFDSETGGVDYDNGHSTTTNTSRYTAATAGWYLVSGSFSFSGNATGQRFAAWHVNGTILTATARGFATVPNAGSFCLGMDTRAIFLNVGDYVELGVTQNSGSSLTTVISSTVAPSMTVAWISS